MASITISGPAAHGAGRALSAYTVAATAGHGGGSGTAAHTAIWTVVNSGFGSAHATVAYTGTVLGASAWSGGWGNVAAAVPVVTPITPDIPGYGYTGRSRTATAIAVVTPPLAPPPPAGPPTPDAPTSVAVALTTFGIPRVSETYQRPRVINGVPYAGPMSISTVSDANPATVTIDAGHGLVTGDTVTISRVAGATGVNGTWTITVTGETTFTVPVAAGGAYTSGGTVTPALRTPWRPATITRETWAKQLQVVVGGQDVTFFRNVPTGVVSWSSQDPFGDATAVIAFPSAGSFDSFPVPAALAVGTVVGIAGSYTGNGYWQVSVTGVVSCYGDASFFGDQLGLLNEPIVGIASHPSDYGYVLAAADGGVFCYGAIGFAGSLVPTVPAAPISGVAVTATGDGYWLVGEDGGVFAFGDAAFHGNAVGDIGWPTNKAVGIARSASGNGYVIAADNGGVFCYGDAAFRGNGIDYYIAPYVAVATCAGVDGYLLINSEGAAYAFGQVAYHGGVNPIPLAQPMNSVWILPSDGGYWMSAGDGGVFALGSAQFLGSQPGGGITYSGSLSWLRLGSPVTVNCVTPAGAIKTLFEGVVADIDDASGPGLQAQCVGVCFQADWYLAKPIVNLPFVGYDPATGKPIFGWDVGEAIAAAFNSLSNPGPGTAVGSGPVPGGRPGPWTGNACTPVSTGILTAQRGAWDKLLSSYVSSILAQASSTSGIQWTVMLARPRTPVITRTNTEVINWTVWTGGHGVDTSGLALDQTTPANAIYGSGTAPTTFSTVGVTTTGESARWANSKYPVTPPPAPAFPLGAGGSFAPGDGQGGFSPFSDWMRRCGYPLASADTYQATNVAVNRIDQVLIEQYQQMAGLEVTGKVDETTWASAWLAGTTAGAVSSVYYQPLAEVAEIEPYAYNPSGDWVGNNPFYNPRIPRVERYEQMGQNVDKAQGILSAQMELGRIQTPVWQGEITLTGDPAEGSRFAIAAGDNILLKEFHGRDWLLHISRVSVDPTPQQMSVRLTVSATATALQTLAAIIARDFAAHGVQRSARPSLISLNVSSSVITFDSESGAGLVPSTALVGGGWTVIRVPFSEYGQVVQTNLQTSPPAEFAFAVFSGPVTPVTINGAFSGNNPFNSVATGSNPWNFYAVPLASLGLLYAAGGPSAPCGYWPSDPSLPQADQTLTGAYEDNSSWTYAPAPSFVPWLWVAFYSLTATTVSGHFLPAPAS